MINIGNRDEEIIIADSHLLKMIIEEMDEDTILCVEFGDGDDDRE